MKNNSSRKGQGGIMKQKLTEPKFKSASALNPTCRLFSTAVCLGAVILTCSSAMAQNLFVTAGLFGDNSGNIYKYTPNGVRSTFAAGLSSPGDLAFDTAGNLFVAETGNGSRGSGSILKFTPGGVRSTFVLGLNGPIGLAFDSAGNLFVADSTAIYKFTPAGVRTTFASGLEWPWGLAFDRAGNLFVTD